MNTISDDKLIDLWLFTYTYQKHPLRGFFGYGYDTDHYFGFTSRDQNMARETRRWLERFFKELDECTAEQWLTGYDPPSDEAIRDFLKTGVFNP